MKNFNEKLKVARANAGLTQKATAELLGVPRRTYEDWEAGKRKPTDFVKNAILEKLSKDAERRGEN